MYEASDTLEGSPTYSKGDIVWVKLSSYWWPGEVITEDDLPADLLSDFKKPPLVIVKFFDEDSYEYVKVWSSIYPYNTDKKSEFIKKGMTGFRSKLSHMAKFPKDIGTAEERTDGNPNILSQPEFLPVKKINYDELFGTASPKKPAKGKTSLPSAKKTPSKDKNQPHITHRRFLGNDDYRAYICIQYPGKDRQWDSDDEEIKKLNEEPEKLLSCHSCSFKTKRLEVMILHTKMHIQGIYVTSKRKPKKAKGAEVGTDSESDAAAAKSPKPKQRKKKEVKVKTTDDVFSNLLDEWDDTDEEMEEPITPKKPKKKPVPVAEKKPLDSEKKETQKDKPTDVLAHTSTTIEASNGTAHTEPVKPETSNKNTYDDIKNCFDFDEEEEDDDILLPASVGRKIPRVIPEKPKPSISELLEQSQKEDELEEKKASAESVGETEKTLESSKPAENGADASKREILRLSQSVNKAPDIDENIETTFKELMAETELPPLDDLAQNLKPEQNFHDARTVKFPDKGGTALKCDTTSTGGTSKKRFVTSFEDFEAGFRKLEGEEMMKRDKEVKTSRTSSAPQSLPDQTEPINETAESKEDSGERKEVPREAITPSKTSTIAAGVHEKGTSKKSPRGKHSGSRSDAASNESAVEQKNVRPTDTTVQSVGRRKTRQSDKEASTESAVDVRKNTEDVSADNAALDSQRKLPRRRTKQFVIEEDSEEIIEIACDNVADSSEQIVGHLDEKTREKLAAIDLEIQTLKNDLGLNESTSEKDEVCEEMLRKMPDKTEGPIESSAEQIVTVDKERESFKAETVPKKSQRTTRRSLTTENLRKLDEKLQELSEHTPPVDETPSKARRKITQKSPSLAESSDIIKDLAGESFIEICNESEEPPIKGRRGRSRGRQRSVEIHEKEKEILTSILGSDGTESKSIESLESLDGFVAKTAGSILKEQVEVDVHHEKETLLPIFTEFTSDQHVDPQHTQETTKTVVHLTPQESSDELKASHEVVQEPIEPELTPRSKKGRTKKHPKEVPLDKITPVEFPTEVKLSESIVESSDLLSQKHVLPTESQTFVPDLAPCSSFSKILEPPTPKSRRGRSQKYAKDEISAVESKTVPEDVPESNKVLADIAGTHLLVEVHEEATTKTGKSRTRRLSEDQHSTVVEEHIRSEPKSAEQSLDEPEQAVTDITTHLIDQPAHHVVKVQEEPSPKSRRSKTRPFSREKEQHATVVEEHIGSEPKSGEPLAEPEQAVTDITPHLIDQPAHHVVKVQEEPSPKSRRSKTRPFSKEKEPHATVIEKQIGSEPKSAEQSLAEPEQAVTDITTHPIDQPAHHIVKVQEEPSPKSRRSKTRQFSKEKEQHATVEEHIGSEPKAAEPEKVVTDITTHLIDQPALHVVNVQEEPSPKSRRSKTRPFSREKEQHATVVDEHTGSEPKSAGQSLAESEQAVTDITTHLLNQPAHHVVEVQEEPSPKSRRSKTRPFSKEKEQHATVVDEHVSKNKESLVESKQALADITDMHLIEQTTHNVVAVHEEPVPTTRSSRTRKSFKEIPDSAEQSSAEPKQAVTDTATHLIEHPAYHFAKVQEEPIAKTRRGRTRKLSMEQVQHSTPVEKPLFTNVESVPNFTEQTSAEPEQPVTGTPTHIVEEPSHHVVKVQEEPISKTRRGRTRKFSMEQEQHATPVEEPLLTNMESEPNSTAQSLAEPEQPMTDTTTHLAEEPAHDVVKVHEEPISKTRSGRTRKFSMEQEQHATPVEEPLLINVKSEPNSTAQSLAEPEQPVTGTTTHLGEEPAHDVVKVQGEPISKTRRGRTRKFSMEQEQHATPVEEPVLTNVESEPNSTAQSLAEPEQPVTGTTTHLVEEPAHDVVKVQEEPISKTRRGRTRKVSMEQQQHATLVKEPLLTNVESEPNSTAQSLADPEQLVTGTTTHLVEEPAHDVVKVQEEPISKTRRGRTRKFSMEQEQHATPVEEPVFTNVESEPNSTAQSLAELEQPVTGTTAHLVEEPAHDVVKAQEEPISNTRRDRTCKFSMEQEQHATPVEEPVLTNVESEANSTAQSLAEPERPVTNTTSHLLEEPAHYVVKIREEPISETRRGRTRKFSMEQEQHATPVEEPLLTNMESDPNFTAQSLAEPEEAVTDTTTHLVEKPAHHLVKLQEEPISKTRRGRSRKFSMDQEQHTPVIEEQVLTTLEPEPNFAEQSLAEPEPDTSMHLIDQPTHHVVKVQEEPISKSRKSRARKFPMEQEQHATPLEEHVLTNLEPEPDSAQQSLAEPEQAVTDTSTHLVDEPADHIVKVQEEPISKTRRARKFSMEQEQHTPVVEEQVLTSLESERILAEQSLAAAIPESDVYSGSVLEILEEVTTKSRRGRPRKDTKYREQDKSTIQEDKHGEDNVVQAVIEQATDNLTDLEVAQPSENRSLLEASAKEQTTTDIGDCTNKNLTLEAEPHKVILADVTVLEGESQNAQSILSKPDIKESVTKRRKSRSRPHTKEQVTNDSVDDIQEARPNDAVQEATEEPAVTNVSVIETVAQVDKTQNVESTDSDYLDKIIEHPKPKSKNSRKKKNSKEERSSKGATRTKQATKRKEYVAAAALSTFAMPEEPYTRRGRSRKLTKEEEDFARAIEESLKDIAQQQNRVEAIIIDQPNSENEVKLSESNESIADPVITDSSVQEPHSSSSKSKKGKSRKHSKSKEHVNLVFLDKEDRNTISESDLSEIPYAKRRRSRASRDQVSTLEENLSKDLPLAKKAIDHPLAVQEVVAHTVEMEKSAFKSDVDEKFELTPSTRRGRPRKHSKEEQQSLATVLEAPKSIEPIREPERLKVLETSSHAHINQSALLDPDISDTVVQMPKQSTSKSKRGRTRKQATKEDVQATIHMKETSRIPNEKQAEELSAALEFTKTVLELVEHQQTVLKTNVATEAVVQNESDVLMEVTSLQYTVKQTPEELEASKTQAVVLEPINSNYVVDIKSNSCKNTTDQVTTDNNSTDVVFSTKQCMEVVDNDVAIPQASELSTTTLKSTVPLFEMTESTFAGAKTDGSTPTEDTSSTVPESSRNDFVELSHGQETTGDLSITKVIEQSNSVMSDFIKVSEKPLVKVRKGRTRKQIFEENTESTIGKNKPLNTEPESAANTSSEVESKAVKVDAHFSDLKVEDTNRLDGSSKFMKDSMGSIIQKAIDQSLGTLDTIPKSGLSEWVGELLKISSSKEEGRLVTNNIEKIESKSYDVLESAQVHASVATRDESARALETDTLIQKNNFECIQADIDTSTWDDESDHKTIEALDNPAETVLVKKNEKCSAKCKKVRSRKSGSGEPPSIQEAPSDPQIRQDATHDEKKDVNWLQNVQSAIDTANLNIIDSETTKEIEEAPQLHSLGVKLNLTTSQESIVEEQKDLDICKLNEEIITSAPSDPMDTKSSIFNENVQTPLQTVVDSSIISEKLENNTPTCLESQNDLPTSLGPIFETVPDIVKSATLETVSHEGSENLTALDEHPAQTENEDFVPQVIQRINEYEGVQHAAALPSTAVTPIKSKGNSRKMSISEQDNEVVSPQDSASLVPNLEKIETSRYQKVQLKKRLSGSWSKSRQPKLSPENFKTGLKQKYSNIICTEASQEADLKSKSLMQSPSNTERIPSIAPSQSDSIETLKSTDNSLLSLPVKPTDKITDTSLVIHSDTETINYPSRPGKRYRKVSDDKDIIEQESQETQLWDKDNIGQHLERLDEAVDQEAPKTLEEIIPRNKKGKARRYSKQESTIFGESSILETNKDKTGSLNKATDFLKAPQSEEKSRQVPPKKNRWPRRESYAKNDDDTESDKFLVEQIVPTASEAGVCDEIVIEEQVIEEQVVEINDDRKETIPSESERVADQSEDKCLFKNIDFLKSDKPENVSGILENSVADFTDTEFILPPKKSKRVSEVKFNFLNDSFASTTFERKADSDILSFPNCDDSIMSTSLRNNIEGLIKDIDSFDNGNMSDNLHTTCRDDADKIDVMKSDLNSYSLTDTSECIKEPADISKCVPPKKKRIEYSKQDVASSSIINLPLNDTIKSAENLADTIPQPPKKKIQKLFESSQALEKLGKVNDLPQMSPLAKKKSFLFHQEEFVKTQQVSELSPHIDVAATTKEAEKSIDIGECLLEKESTTLKPEEVSASTSDIKEDEVSKSSIVPKKRKKRKSSCYEDHLQTKERRTSSDVDTIDGQNGKNVDFCTVLDVPQSQDEKQVLVTTTTIPANISVPGTPVDDNVNDDEHKNEIGVNLKEDDFTFSIHTNLSNLATTAAAELSAIATATLSEIKNEVIVESSDKTSSVSSKENELAQQVSATVKEDNIEPIVKKDEIVAPLDPVMLGSVVLPNESEFVPISLHPTVMSEKDLADAQVEITTDKVISEKKPTSLGMFSMDYLETSHIGKTISIKIKKTEVVGGTKKVNNTSGTEFTSKAMTKEFDNRALIAQPKAYALKSELLDILEGNSNSSTNSSGSEQKFKTSFDNYDKQTVVQGMFDFEEAIPSQIVLSNKVDPETVLMDSPKLLERLSMSGDASKVTTKKVLIQSDIKVPESISKGLISKMTKPMGTPRPGQRIIIKTTKAQAITALPKVAGNKPIIISEQIIRPANAIKLTKTAIQPQGIKRQYEDIEDVETAFIIPKMAKTSVEEEVVSASPEKPPPRARNTKIAGKAKILQQTIITPKGEIVQSQTPASSKTTSSPLVQPMQTQSDDTVFDINSMPIVLSDDILTAESIQNMPVVLSEDVIPHSTPVSLKVEEKVVPTLAKKIIPHVTPKQQIIFKTTPTTTPLPVKQTTKARILSNAPVSTIKPPKPTALLATGTSADGKQTKYVLVPSTVTPVVPQVKAVKPPIVKKQPVIQSKLATIQTGEPPSPIVGNKIMIVTNQHGQQTRVVLTPQQQKAFMQAQPGSKTKAIIKGAIPKALLESAAAGPSGVIQKVSLPSVTQVATTTVSSQGGLLMTVGKGVKTPPVQAKKPVPRTPSKPQKTILIKNQMGQTVRKIQGTDDADLDRQVAEQLEAIKASARLQQANKLPEIINYTNRAIASSTSTAKTPVRRSYAKKVDPVKVKPTVSVPQAHTQKPTEAYIPALAPLSPKPIVSQVPSQISPNLSKPPPSIKVDHPPSSSPLSKALDAITQPQVAVSTKHESKSTVAPSGGAESKPTDRPLTQLVIQDGLGNQTTITEGQILAIPSETVDGQPQSYMLVTLDELGNITPLNNEALMSLDPSLGLGGDLNNMVLQVDQGQGTVAALRPAEPTVPEQAKVAERLHLEPPQIAQTVPEPKHAPVELPRPHEVPLSVEQQIVIDEGVLPGADAGGQQLIVTGDPIATQKFLESLSDGSTDLANILANAEGGSVLIQADGQQILIKTNTGGQSMLGISENTEGGGNPIFGAHKPNQDILAAALANTDVFQPSDQPAIHSSPIKGMQSSQLSPSGGSGVLYPMHVSNVLETSLTLNSPIMTPLEVPSLPNKKIHDDVDILSQVPKNVDLPITITDPNISQTVAQQQAIGLMELTLPISETTVSSDINSPSYSYSLPALDEPVGQSQKPFNGSMPLLTEDVTEMETGGAMGKIRVAKGLQSSESTFSSTFGSLPLLPETIESSREEVVKTSSCFGEMESLPMLTEDAMEDSGSSMGSSKPPRSSPKSLERDMVDEGLSTLGGEMCSSLSEPPPDMFDLASITAKEEEVSSDMSSIPEPEGETLSLHSENSGEIPIQPQIVANLNDLKRPGDEAQDGQEEKRQKFD